MGGMRMNQKLKEIQIQMEEITKRGNYDKEVNHSDADDLLCKALKELGQNKLVDTWNKISKWYA